MAGPIGEHRQERGSTSPWGPYEAAVFASVLCRIPGSNAQLLIRFRAGHCLVWAILMPILWMGAFSLCGMSATYLGRFGTSIAWGLFQIFMILTATPGGRLQWRVEICPAFGSNSPGLEHRLSQRRDAAFGIRKSNETSLDQICGLNLDQGNGNTEFFEWRNR